MYLNSMHLYGLLLLNIIITLPGVLFAQKTPSVIVYKAQVQKWHDNIEALGTLQANETVVLTASVTDTITNIHFDDGQRVEKGFVLAEMTDSEESALVSEMTVRLDEARRQFERLKNLPKSGAISASLYDQREREYEAARAQLEAMTSRLKDRLIVAPFGGTVGLRNISVGALVEPGDEIATLSDDSVMKLDFSVPSIFLGSLKVDLPIEATTSAFPEKTFSGKITAIDSRIDPVTRSISVRAKIPNEEKELKPGLLMSVDLSYRPREAIVVPEEALISVRDSFNVFVVDSESMLVEEKPIKIGSRQPGLVEVTQGLKDGQLVITHGAFVARPGQKVEIQTVQKTGDSISELIARGKAK